MLIGCSINEISSPSPAPTSTLPPTRPPATPTPTPSPTTATLRRRAAGMLVVGFTGRTLPNDDPILKAIRAGLGGVILFSRNIDSPQQLATLTAKLRAAAGTRPLLIAIDQEGGAVARLNPANGFARTPPAAQVGARNDPVYARRVGAKIGTMLRDSGINLNLAPVVDLNVNPANPSIGALGRSYSADPDVVVAMASKVMAAQRKRGVLTTLKHFPGLGSATGDTDHEFVDVSAMWSDAELEPFRRLIASGAPDLVMLANAFNDQLDARHPASLSAATLSLLRDGLGWRGATITDDLMAGAITANYAREDALRLAINAGNDLLLLANTGNNATDLVQPALDSIEKLVAAGKVTEAQIDGANARIAALL
ncbi:MAG TPA: glycoside hydrolase family 3 N-terminal domain-containing protein [Candidatus Limnocylindria bacterium]|nr:glycoside hydrolase family 3 N-terminal domain-containing protein [Candidatus Limnocylindria bacterium]